jgi:hypothetical protein
MLPVLAQMVDGLFVRRCKQGALQFVLVMPILGILSTVLYATGFYHPGNWHADSSCASFPVPLRKYKATHRRLYDASLPLSSCQGDTRFERHVSLPNERPAFLTHLGSVL